MKKTFFLCLIGFFVVVVVVWVFYPGSIPSQCVIILQKHMNIMSINGFF